MSQAPTQREQMAMMNTSGVHTAGAASHGTVDHPAATTDATYDSSQQNSLRLQKTVLVELKGNMSDFAGQGPTAATWRITEGKHAAVFGMDDMSGTMAEADEGNSMMNASLAAATNSLKCATILKATVLQSHNTFPVPLGVNVSCLARNEVADGGDAYTFTTLPCTTVNTPYVVYTAGNSIAEAKEWQRHYSKYTAENLDTEGVMQADKSGSCPYTFVHKSHPAVNLLRMNKNLVGFDIDKAVVMDNAWYKIGSDLMMTANETLRTRVLPKVRTSDLSRLAVQLHRIGGVPWNHVDPTDTLMSFNADPSWDADTLRTNLQAHESNYTEKPAVFLCRLALEYEINQ